MCGGFFDNPERPDIPAPPPPEPDPAVFQPGSEQDSNAPSSSQTEKKGKKSLTNDAVGLSIPTEG